MTWECKSRQTSKHKVSPVLGTSANLRRQIFNFRSMQATREKEQGPPKMSFYSGISYKKQTLGRPILYSFLQIIEKEETLSNFFM